MTTSKSDLLFLFAKKISEWEQNPKRMESGYEYEKTFVDMWQTLGLDIFQESIGSLPKSRNSKKNSRPAWEK